MTENKGDTWPKILKYNFEKYGDRRRAMRQKHYGIWQAYTWRDYYLNVKALALGLMSLGFSPGDKVMIVGENAPEWYYAELAAQAIHGVAVGGCPDLLPREIKTLAEKADIRFAIVEDQEQVDKFLEIKSELPLLQKIIYWNYKGLAHYQDPLLIGYKQTLKKGQKYEAENPGLFEHLVETGQSEDLAALVFTSGTSGDQPQAAIHTFRTMKGGAEYLLQLEPWREDDNVIPLLPPAWMPEQWLGIGCHLLSACTLNFAESPETQQRDTRETNPSIVFYDGRIWESLASEVQARINNNDVLQRFCFRLLMPVGYRRMACWIRNKKPGLPLTILYRFADWVLFRPLKKSLGLSKARICYSTESFLSPESFNFFQALNLPLKSLYHTTEGGPLLDAREADIPTAALGLPPKGTEVKITETGELLYFHPGTFVGYYKAPERTAEVLQEGWFMSGETGFLREDGHLVGLDRTGNLVEVKNGEKLAPQRLESRLKFSPFIKEAWVLAGSNKTFVSAVIIINYDTVRRWAGQNRVPYTSFADLSQKPEVYELVKQDIDRVNRTLAPAGRIKKYVNLYKELDPNEGELTRNKKLRRHHLEVQFRSLIDSIYGEATEVPMEIPVKFSDGRTGTVLTTLSIQSVEGGSE
ncbi:MAG: AMP-binding protein [Deltaproteobacteria bacterium]|nr:AMP-binding protein [Deltaproteobacteria bacterium]